MSKCGVAYKIADNPQPPTYAKWRLIFWDKVVFGMTELAMIRFRNRHLTYHQAEDCQIERFGKGR